MASLPAYVDLPDALEAMEQAVITLIRIAGHKPGEIRALPDSVTGTASVSHFKGSDGLLHAEVHFPIACADARLSRAEVERWIAYFLHEVSHVLYTCESTMLQAQREGLHKITNGLEDVRIERELIRANVSDNARELLTDLMQWAESKIPAEYDPNDTRQIPWTLAYLGRWKVLGYALSKAPAQYARLHDPAIIAAIDAVAKAKTTGDCLEIARRLMQGVAQRPGANEGKGQQQGKGQGEAQGQQGEEAREGESDNGQGGDKGQQGESDKGQQQGEIAQQDAQGGGGNGASLSDSDMIDSEELLDPRSDATKQQAQREIQGTFAAHSNREVIELIRELRAKPRRSQIIGERRHDAIKPMRESIAQEALRAGRMKQQAVRVLKAPDSTLWNRNQNAGRLDKYAYGRIGAGATESVYGRRTYAQGYETAITLLIDGSGSMQGPCAKAASVFALALAQAAEQVAVSCEVRVFKDGGDAIAKARNERIATKTIQDRLAVAALTASGGTPLSKAIMDNANRLHREQPNKRKIIFALTDGGCNKGPLVLKGAALYAGKLGVEIVGLSIDSGVHGCFAHEVAVYSGDDIAGAGLGALVHVLEQKVGA